MSDNEETHNHDEAGGENRHPSLLQVIGSVLAAGFGVQSSKNRKRDFQHGKPIVYIIAGIIFTVLFILTIYLIVSTVIERSGIGAG